MYIYIYDVFCNQNTERGMYGDAEHVVNNRMFGFFPNGVNMLPQKKIWGQIFGCDCE